MPISVNCSAVDLNELVLKLWRGAPCAPFYGMSGDVPPSEPTLEEVEQALAAGYIDYCNGRPIKTDFSNPDAVSSNYNRDAGDGAFERILASMPKTADGGKLPPQIVFASPMDRVLHTRDMGCGGMPLSDKCVGVKIDTVGGAPARGSAGAFLGPPTDKFNKVWLTPRMVKIARKAGIDCPDEFFVMTRVDVDAGTYYLCGSMGGRIGPFGWNQEDILSQVKKW